MRSGPVPAAFLLALAIVRPAAGQGERTETLLKGEKRTLAFEFAIGDAAIGNDRVCDIRILPSRKEILLTSVAAGTTTLVIWDQQRTKRDEIRVEVLSKETARLKEDLVERLRFAPSVNVSTLGTRLTLVGTVDSAQQLDRVQEIAAAAGSSVVSLVTLRPGIRTETPGPATTSSGKPAAAGVPTTGPGVGLGGAATPVPLGSGAAAPPSAAPPSAAPPTTSPAAQPAAPAVPPVAPAAAPTSPTTVAPATVPPPTVVTPTPTVSQPQPVAPTSPPPVTPISPPPPAAVVPPAPSLPAAPPAVPAPPVPPAPVAVTEVTYLIDLVEVPANSPPPDAMTPKGRKLTSVRVVAAVGQPIRHFIDARQIGALGDDVEMPTGSVTGISFAFQPSIEAGGSLRTVMAIDTNLPLGQLPAPGPGRWTRATFDLDAAAGRPTYLTEEALAGWLGSGQTYAAAAGPDGPDVVEIIGAVTGTARAKPDAPPASRGNVSKPRDKALLIVITPYPGTGK